MNRPAVSRHRGTAGHYLRVSWVTDWGEAAKRPKRTLAFLFVAGLVCGGLLGYLSDRSVAWAVIVGTGVAAVLTVGGWKSMRDPILLRWSGSSPDERRRRIARGTLRLAVTFATIPIALGIGLATGSARAFVIALAVGIAVTFLFGRTVLR